MTLGKLAVMFLIGMASFSSISSAKPVQVVATIKPIHSLLAGLMQGAGEPVLLIRDATPFTYKPTDKDLALVKKADLVVWMGPELEQSFTDVLLKPTASMNVFEMLSDSEFKVLSQRNDDNLRDSFMWLDVRNGEVFVDALFDELMKIAPEHQKTFSKNRDRLKQKIAHLDRMFEFGFRSVPAGLSWLYHDTQQYFEQSYGFKVRNVLSLKPGEVADTMNLLKVRDKMNGIGEFCFFTEKGMTTDRLSIALDGTKAKLVALDSFGLGYKAGPDLYVQVMQHNYDAIRGCFKDIKARYIE